MHYIVHKYINDVPPIDHAQLLQIQLVELIAIDVTAQLPLGHGLAPVEIHPVHEAGGVAFVPRRADGVTVGGDGGGGGGWDGGRGYLVGERVGVGRDLDGDESRRRPFVF